MRYEVYDNKQCFVMEEFLEMRRYEKPTLGIERFTTDMNVASSACTRVLDTDAFTTIGSQTVNCVCTSSETGFSQVGGCSNILSAHQITSSESGTYYGYEILKTFAGVKIDQNFINTYPALKKSYTLSEGSYILIWGGKHVGVVSTTTVPAVYSHS